MRVGSAFSRLLRLKGVWVRAVRFERDRVVVVVALRRRRLQCPGCSFSTRYRHDVRGAQSVWRHLDLGVWRLEIRATLRRLSCPVHGVRTEGVPFARAGSDFTRDFEALVAFLASRTDKTTIARLVRINWRTVGRIIERVCAAELDPHRLDELFEIGIDEVSWRKQHRYLTLVCDHQRRRVVWGTEGAGEKAGDEFFTELGTERSSRIRAVSMDMGPGYAKSARKHAPHATICIDSYHVVALATKALDEVRRDYWNELRSLGDQQAARRFKDARWALLKNPENLTERQSVTYRKLKRAGGEVWRAYTLKEALRAIFAAGLTLADVSVLIDRFISRATRSRLAPFIRLAQTITKHREGILAAIRLGITSLRPRARARRRARIVPITVRVTHKTVMPTKSSHASMSPAIVATIQKSLLTSRQRGDKDGRLVFDVFVSHIDTPELSTVRSCDKIADLDPFIRDVDDGGPSGRYRPAFMQCAA